MMVVVEVVLVLGPPTSPHRMLISVYTGMLVGFVHLKFYCISSSVASLRKRDYLDNATGNSSFFVADGDAKEGVSPINTQL